MADEESATSQESAGQKPCYPLPIGLYDYSGLLFELYQGGKQPVRHCIFWSRIRPVPQSPPSGAAT
jgi:hypothetical protein